MKPITLHAHTRVAPENKGAHVVELALFQNRVEWLAKGLVARENTFEDESGTCSMCEVHHEEQVPVRLYSPAQSRNPIVVPINGRKYTVTLRIDDDGGMPTGATVSFTPTDAPETPYRTWDAADALKSRLAELRTEREEIHALLQRDPEWVTQSIERIDRDIRDLESGTWVLQPHAPLRFFGVPDFLQTGIFPAVDGVAAQCLAVLDTGWGDDGNINLLFSCDKDGVPNRVWFEANCK